MTERERLLEKIRKVQALANRGADGEKQSAAALLDKLMKQYGIDEAEIAEERLEKCFFRYKTPYERKLLVQVIYTVTGKIPFKCVGSYSGRARKQVGIILAVSEVGLECQLRPDAEIYSPYFITFAADLYGAGLEINGTCGDVDKL